MTLSRLDAASMHMLCDVLRISQTSLSRLNSFPLPGSAAAQLVFAL